MNSFLPRLPGNWLAIPIKAYTVDITFAKFEDSSARRCVAYGKSSDLNCTVWSSQKRDIDLIQLGRFAVGATLDQ
uniref:AlNc14C62G4511 protein n=1 Tax=Albugo laibachii Nc14 TaxID=890382 RepID=F0WCY7_9STRA|nr:AlNc14C62G4511 [Albugo laibachii Nc14]|eukprot:CCA19058.1 AlNc14C62G4511 [Albugo laibachii Nc14]